MNRFKTFLDGMRTPRRIAISRGSLIGAALALTACLTTPLWAAPFFFATGSPNTLLGALSRRSSPGKVETETADDFFLQETTVITHATIFGLIPAGTPLENIRDVEVEVYHVFPMDSDVGRTSGSPTFSTSAVPTRNNSPSDSEIDTATRARTAGTLAVSARVLNTSFTAGTTVPAAERIAARPRRRGGDHNHVHEPYHSAVRSLFLPPRGSADQRGFPVLVGPKAHSGHAVVARSASLDPKCESDAGLAANRYRHYRRRNTAHVQHGVFPDR